MTASRRLLIAGGVFAGGCVLWLPAASLMYCWVTRRMELFVWPYGQWLEAAPYWRMHWLMTVYIIVSAGLPTMFLLAIVAGLLRRQIINSGLYGRSSWASAEDMRHGGIVTEREP